MRLVTYLRNEMPRPGVVVNDTIVDLGDHFTGLQSIIKQGGAAPAPLLARIRDIVEGAVAPQTVLPLQKAHLLAPIPAPRRNIFCVGWNYLAHFEEGRAQQGLQQRGGEQRDGVADPELPAHPTFFTKTTTAANGPYDPIPLHPSWTRRLDYEAELAVVIGRAGRDITETDAMDYVFGYMVANDVSARELQRRHGGQWLKGKSLDGSCPMGPWLVTADAVADPHALQVRCWVNGELRQQANTVQMIFSIARIIAELSHGMTLLPGDVILTGTPEGVGFARTPPTYLQPGDEVVVDISGIGQLRNRVTAC